MTKNHFRSLRLTLIFSILSLSSITFSSCSLITNQEPEQPKDLADLKSIELTLRKSSTTTQDFEQYKLINEILFFECGSFEGGRRKATESAVVNLPEAQARDVLHNAALLHANLRISAESLPKSGEANGFFDPGIYHISFGQISHSPLEHSQISTSLDAVAEAGRKIEKQLKVFTEQIRGLTPKPICANKVFYGISRSEP